MGADRVPRTRAQALNARTSAHTSTGAPTHGTRPPHRRGMIPGSVDISVTKSARSDIKKYAVLHPYFARLREMTRDIGRSWEILRDTTAHLLIAECADLVA